MLVEGALGRDIHLLGLGDLQLGLGASDIETRDGAALMQDLGQMQSLRVVLGGVGEQLGLGVEAAKVDVRLGELGLEAQAHGGRVRGAGLGLRLAGGDQVAHPAP